MDVTLKELTVVWNALKFLLVRQAPNPWRWSRSSHVSSGLLPCPAGRLASGFSGFRLGSPWKWRLLPDQLCTLSSVALGAAQEETGEGSGPWGCESSLFWVWSLVLFWKDLCGLDSVPGGSLLSSI